MVEHSTADREVTGSNPIAPFNSLSLLFSVPKVYPPIYDVPATTECLMAESGSLTQVSRVGFLASPYHSSSCIIQC